MVQFFLIPVGIIFAGFLISVVFFECYNKFVLRRQKKEFDSLMQHSIKEYSCSWNDALNYQIQSINAETKNKIIDNSTSYHDKLGIGQSYLTENQTH